MPEAIRNELYREERERHERQGKDKRKGGPLVGSGVPYPPCNIINVLPPQSSAQGLDVSTPEAEVVMSMSSLDIPDPRDVAVEYSEWEMSTVENDTLKSAFRQVCDVMLDNGLDLEQVYKDQNPKSFIEKGIKIGIARRFVEDIGNWAEQVKKAIPIYEIL